MVTVSLSIIEEINLKIKKYVCKKKEAFMDSCGIKRELTHSEWCMVLGSTLRL